MAQKAEPKSLYLDMLGCVAGIYSEKKHSVVV